MKKVNEFITGPVEYDAYGGQYFWVKEPNGGIQMLAELRGWGHIQNMFGAKGKSFDGKAASEFQDQIGRFIADAINEKMEREFGNTNNLFVEHK